MLEILHLASILNILDRNVGADGRNETVAGIGLCLRDLNVQIVVAMIEDSATVKRFYKEKGHIRLQPENDFMDPIIVDDVQILGKVIGLLRLRI